MGFLTASELQLSPAWFEEGLRKLGYVPGSTIVIESRGAGGRHDLLPKLAAELAALPLDVLVVGGPPPLAAAMAAAPRTPIVMIASSSDPVGEGLVASLARPGGNLTGITYAVSPERFGKQLELLKHVAPATRRVAVWWDFDAAIFQRSWRAPLEVAARRLDLDVLAPRPVMDRAGVVPEIGAMKRHGADAMLVAIGGTTWPYATLVAEEAVRQRLPTMSAFKEFTDVGGLVSYGPDFPALYERGAAIVDRILRGARPGDVPIELPSKYELAVNLKTAKALALDVPADLLVRADRVVR